MNTQGYVLMQTVSIAQIFVRMIMNHNIFVNGRMKNEINFTKHKTAILRVNRKR